MNEETRLKCYAEIRDCMKSRLVTYYTEHSDILGDERSQRAIKESIAGLDCIFSVLEKYELRQRKDP